MKVVILEEFKSDFWIKEIDKGITGNGEVFVRIKPVELTGWMGTFKIFRLKIVEKCI
ncbi:hypothetical protein GJU43_01970 [Flavobacterium sp. LC2016-23]|uniref:hypothetical protein n=1 Tax=Flavobacterium sp. LC2016-23 TaxID=2666330 RepID=UPI0012B093E8|nr:hypothetical protein [Flavobacterium sp. LC2016-23]MRX38031.1 hypothetical protein [Flavobacterium sp. LC2016-23]